MQGAGKAQKLNRLQRVKEEKRTRLARGGRRRRLRLPGRGRRRGSTSLVSASNLNLDELAIHLQCLLDGHLEVVGAPDRHAVAVGHQEGERRGALHLIFLADASLQDLEARGTALELNEANLAVIVEANFQLQLTTSESTNYEYNTFQ